MPKDSAQQQTKHLIEVVKPLRLIEDANKDELKPQEAAIEILTTVTNLFKNHTDFYHAIELNIDLSNQQKEDQPSESETVENLEKQQSVLKNEIANAQARDKSYFEAKQRVEKEDINEDVETQLQIWNQFEKDLGSYNLQVSEWTDVVGKKNKGGGQAKTESGDQSTPHKTRSRPPAKPNVPELAYDFGSLTVQEIVEQAHKKCDVKYDRLFIKARDVQIEYNSKLAEVETKILELTRNDKSSFIEQIYFAGYASAEALLVIKIKDIVNYPKLVEMKQKLEQSQENNGINQSPLESNSLRVILKSLKEAYAKPSFSTFHSLKQKMHHDSLQMRMAYGQTSKVSDYDKVITSTSKDLLIMDNLRVFEMYNNKDYEFVFTLLLRLNPNDPLRQEIIEEIVKREREAETQAEKSSMSYMSSLTEQNLAKLEQSDMESTMSYAGSRKPDNKMNLFYVAKKMIQDKRDLLREIDQLDEAKSTLKVEKDESETEAYATDEKEDISKKALKCFRSWKKFTTDKEGKEVPYTSTPQRCRKCSNTDQEKWCDEKQCVLMKCYNCQQYGHSATNCYSKVKARGGHTKKSNHE